MCDAPISQLMVAQRNRTLLRSTFSNELDTDIGLTEALYQDINPRVLATPHMPKGKATRDKDFISYDRIHTDQTYQELILPAGLGHFSGVPVIHNDSMTAGIALHRHLSDDAFNDDEARRHETISAVCAPVLELASLIETHNVRRTIDLFGQGKAVAVLDYRGHVRDQNVEFEHFIRSTASRLGSDRKLVLPTQAVQLALKHALGSHIGVVGGAFLTRGDAAPAQWLCRVFPKPPFTVAGPETGHAILVCERIDQPLKLNRFLVQEVFDLTPAETDIADLVFQGKATRDIAAARKVSMETVRSHIKRVLHKTETNRQAELVAKLARFTESSGA
jgi:DNA-binding CsgD family transcriptional regulator